MNSVFNLPSVFCSQHHPNILEISFVAEFIVLRYLKVFLKPSTIPSFTRYKTFHVFIINFPVQLQLLLTSCDELLKKFSFLTIKAMSSERPLFTITPYLLIEIFLTTFYLKHFPRKILLRVLVEEGTG